MKTGGRKTRIVSAGGGCYEGSQEFVGEVALGRWQSGWNSEEWYTVVAVCPLPAVSNGIYVLSNVPKAAVT